MSEHVIKKKKQKKRCIYQIFTKPFISYNNF